MSPLMMKLLGPGGDTTRRGGWWRPVDGGEGGRVGQGVLEPLDEYMLEARRRQAPLLELCPQLDKLEVGWDHRLLVRGGGGALLLLLAAGVRVVALSNVHLRRRCSGWWCSRREPRSVAAALRLLAKIVRPQKIGLRKWSAPLPVFSCNAPCPLRSVAANARPGTCPRTSRDENGTSSRMQDGGSSAAS